MSEPTIGTIEIRVADLVTQGIAEAVKTKLGGYNGPLDKLVADIVTSREPQIRKVIEEAVDTALTGDFKIEIQSAVAHKLARVLVSKMEGEIEKRVTELRASPEVRAKITLAVSKVIEGMGK